MCFFWAQSSFRQLALSILTHVAILNLHYFHKKRQSIDAENAMKITRIPDFSSVLNIGVKIDVFSQTRPLIWKFAFSKLKHEAKRYSKDVKSSKKTLDSKHAEMFVKNFTNFANNGLTIDGIHQMNSRL